MLTPPCPTYTLNTQLRHLTKTNQLPAARRLFDGTAAHLRDAVTWTTLISAYARSPTPLLSLPLLLSMLRQLPPDPFALSAALRASPLPASLSLHALALKSGAFPSSPHLSTSLLNMYSRHTLLSPALQLFRETPLRNTVTFTAAITALVRAREYRRAYNLFSYMGALPISYDSHTYGIILKACADDRMLSHGREIHANVVKLSIHNTPFVANSLATMYSKCGYIHRGILVFQRMPDPDVVAWTTLISALVHIGREGDAVLSFLSMREREKPNAYTYAAVVAACTGMGRVAAGEQVHGLVVREGFAGNMSVGNALVTMYSRGGRLASAEMMFGEMECRDVVSWTSIISAYCKEGCAEEAFRMFGRMRWSGDMDSRANEFTLASLLSVCATGALLGAGRQLHNLVLLAGLQGDASTGSSLITVYAKCGNMGEAGRVFDELDGNDVVSWTAMINGYAEHGRSREAIELFERMPDAGVSPDYVTFIGVLTACGHAGLVDYGLQCFESMRVEYRIKPSREHYGCMVDLLGRAGRLAEAERLIGSMPVEEADEVVWTALLRACAARGDVERGRRAAQWVMKLEPKCAGAHIALSNVYAAMGMWVEAAESRTAMRDRGVMKETGWSSVELTGEGVVMFAAGVRSHPRGAELKTMLELVVCGTKTDLSIFEV